MLLYNVDSRMRNINIKQAYNVYIIIIMYVSCSTLKYAGAY